MTDLTVFVVLDVHKQTISVALVDAMAGAEVRFYGTIANEPDALRSLCRRLSKNGRPLHFCYEAGPCGYGVQRHLTRLRLNFNTGFLELIDLICGFVFSPPTWHYACGV